MSTFSLCLIIFSAVSIGFQNKYMVHMAHMRRINYVVWGWGIKDSLDSGFLRPANNRKPHGWKMGVLSLPTRRCFPRYNSYLPRNRLGDRRGNHPGIPTQLPAQCDRRLVQRHRPRGHNRITVLHSGQLVGHPQLVCVYVSDSGRQWLLLCGI